MRPDPRPRSFAPTLSPLEGRLLLSGGAVAASHAAAQVHPLKKPAPPTLSGTVTGSNEKEQVPGYFAGLLSSGQLQKYGAVTGLAYFSGSSKTLNRSEIILVAGTRKNRLQLNSTQAFAIFPSGPSKVAIKFKVHGATGSFAGLANKTVTAQIQTNFSVSNDFYHSFSSPISLIFG